MSAAPVFTDRFRWYRLAGRNHVCADCAATEHAASVGECNKQNAATARVRGRGHH